MGRSTVFFWNPTFRCLDRNFPRRRLLRKPTHRTVCPSTDLRARAPTFRRRRLEREKKTREKKWSATLFKWSARRSLSTKHIHPSCFDTSRERERERERETSREGASRLVPPWRVLERFERRPLTSLSKLQDTHISFANSEEGGPLKVRDSQLACDPNHSDRFEFRSRGAPGRFKSISNMRTSESSNA